MYAQNAANCNSLQLFLPLLQLFTNYQFKHLPVVRAANERTNSVYCLWDDEVRANVHAGPRLRMRVPALHTVSCSAAHDDAPLLFSHLLSHRHLACLPPCPLTLPCRPISPCLQDLIMRPEKFDESLPASGNLTSVSGGWAHAAIGCMAGPAGRRMHPTMPLGAGSRKLPLCAID